jgi:predicted HTH domain antitoxin
MKTLTMELSDDILASMDRDPSQFLDEMRLIAAIVWYRQGKVSQEIAARIAGLTRTRFLLELARLKVDSFGVDFSQLDGELAHG